MTAREAPPPEWCCPLCGSLNPGGEFSGLGWCQSAACSEARWIDRAFGKVPSPERDYALCRPTTEICV